MTLAEDLLLFVLRNAPSLPGGETPKAYFLLNLLSPVFLGLILACLTPRMEKILLRLVREKR